MGRSSQPEIRNPLLALPAAQELAQLLAAQPELKATFKRLCRELKAQCRDQEANAYARRKGPMVSYWMSTGTWAGHLANACGRG
jgi:hypothetical protein